jgi:metal-responsive CopG/Arc/MetJ family transcriptional regulator
MSIENKPVTGVRLTNEMNDELKAAAKRYLISKSTLVRLAVRRLLREIKKSKGEDLPPFLQ